MRAFMFILITAISLLAQDINISAIKQEFMQKLSHKRSFTQEELDRLLPSKNKIEKIKKEYGYLNVIPKNAKAFVKKLKKENEKEKFEREFHAFIAYLESQHGEFTKKEIQEFKKELETALFPKLYPTFLYLFSISVPKNTTANVFIQLRHLKKRAPNIVYAGVIRGIKLKGFGKELRTYADFLHQDEEIKIHPLIFEKLKVDKVPAFVYALCPKKFRYKQCEYKYIAYGDFGLRYFLQLLADNDKKLGIYLKKFSKE